MSVLIKRNGVGFKWSLNVCYIGNVCVWSMQQDNFYSNSKTVWLKFNVEFEVLII